MTTASQIHPPATAIPCPSWCTTDHSDMPPGAGFHRREVSTEMPGPVGAALWQTDQPGARSGVVIAGEVLSEGQAHDLGLELVRAAEILRRERQAVEA